MWSFKQYLRTISSQGSFSCCYHDDRKLLNCFRMGRSFSNINDERSIEQIRYTLNTTTNLFYTILLLSPPHALTSRAGQPVRWREGVFQSGGRQQRRSVTPRAALGLCFVDVNELHHLLQKCGRI